MIAVVEKLPRFLSVCVERGVLDNATAEAVHQIWLAEERTPACGDPCAECLPTDLLQMLESTMDGLRQALGRAAPSAARTTKPNEGASKDQLIQMLRESESEEEENLALQIALGERLRQMYQANAEAHEIQHMERALELLRQGRTSEAIKSIDL